MKIVRVTVLFLFVAMPLIGAQSDQQQSSAADQADPRVGLAAGFRDAGMAASNMELVINLPKPEGFYDPEAPAGRPRAPQGPPGAQGGRGGRGGGRGGGGGRGTQRPGSGLSFTNSDLAFSGEHLFMGNYHGFNVYNVEDASRAELLSSVVCPGGQGD
ncbi:MAG TPA: DUF305 domain-containing protein, partial [Acidobacteriota bacterium]|nr:DUF305 domain-containing protein [Acidobacteriota bacterium]